VSARRSAKRLQWFRVTFDVQVDVSRLRPGLDPDVAVEELVSDLWDDHAAGVKQAEPIVDSVNFRAEDFEP